MSDENSIDNLSERLNDIVADLEHSQHVHDKRAAEQRALEIRRRIEERQEKRRLEADMRDFDFDDS